MITTPSNKIKDSEDWKDFNTINYSEPTLLNKCYVDMNSRSYDKCGYNYKEAMLRVSLGYCMRCSLWPEKILFICSLNTSNIKIFQGDAKEILEDYKVTLKNIFIKVNSDFSIESYIPKEEEMRKTWYTIIPKKYK